MLNHLSWKICSAHYSLILEAMFVSMGSPGWHDDVIKWKHFPRYWSFVRGIHRYPVNSQHKGQWRGALMFSLICAWINGWVNNREADDLRRYRAHYDVSVMWHWRWSTYYWFLTTNHWLSNLQYVRAIYVKYIVENGATCLNIVTGSVFPCIQTQSRCIALFMMQNRTQAQVMSLSLRFNQIYPSQFMRCPSTSYILMHLLTHWMFPNRDHAMR